MMIGLGRSREVEDGVLLVKKWQKMHKRDKKMTKNELFLVILTVRRGLLAQNSPEHSN